jgi:prepilin-type N-terminal cleavage/methylation domain-containing protein
MKRPPRVGEGFAVAGFSLVELLVVISIIGLLAGLSSVVVPKAMEAGRKSKAKGDLLAIVSAVKAYKQEYGRWPVGASKMDQASDEYNSWYGPPTAAADSKVLMKILSGDSSVTVEGVIMNPKGVRFLEGAAADGSFYDPWADVDKKNPKNNHQYCVKMDTNDSGGLEYYNPAGGNAENIRMTVIALSLGKNGVQEDPDKKATKTCDDIFSWR